MNFHFTKVKITKVVRRPEYPFQLPSSFEIPKKRIALPVLDSIPEQRVFAGVVNFHRDERYFGLHVQRMFRCSV